MSTGEERKVITVVFCDLVGFTERSDQADPEDVKAMLRVYHTLLKRTIEHYGGTVDKFIGDAVLGVFGAPVGHEDDPERAIRAGLQILDDVEEANREQPGLELAVRIGINTGEAVIAFGQGPQIGESVTGDVVNTASRLQNVAPTGTIVVGEATHHATSAIFEYEDLPPVTVKGKAEALAIWRPLRARSLIGMDLREQQRTTFVGRAEESATLRQVFRKMEEYRDQLARVGSPQLVTVVGEPGVGKTRLLREFSTFIDELPDLIRWRQGRCLPYGDGVGFWAFGEIVKAQAGILDSDDPEQAGAKLAEAVDAVVEDPAQRDWIRQRLAPLIGAADGSADVPREELFTAWRRFVEALAYEGRLVLVFEDLHWADVPMLEFIEHLIDEGERPFMVVCAARPELYDRYAHWGEGRRNAIRLSLPPLSDGETALLISSLLERAVLPATTQSILIERSGGNPLFAEEFIQLLVDRGLIDLSSHERPVAELHDIPVPDSLHSLISSRLDQLPARRQVAPAGRVGHRQGVLVGRPRRDLRVRRTIGSRPTGRRAPPRIGAAQPYLQPPGTDRIHVLACADPRCGVRPDPAHRQGGEAPGGGALVEADRRGSHPGLRGRARLPLLGGARPRSRIWRGGRAGRASGGGERVPPGRRARRTARRRARHRLLPAGARADDGRPPPATSGRRARGRDGGGTG